MEGPYDYVPPNYWYEDTERGGAFGFASEICPGPAVPPLASLKKMLPEENHWPVDDVWNFHAGGQEFHNIDSFHQALVQRFGPVESIQDFAEISQLMTYEAQRSMFEAYTVNRPRSTGVIQWMLNNSWPSLIWHLFDYYLHPGGGFFGTKKACEPLHLSYAYDSRTIYCNNEYRKAFEGRFQLRIWNIEGESLYVKDGDIHLQSRGVIPLFQLPSFSSLGIDDSVIFVDLRLFDEGAKEVSSNFYWVPAAQDRLDHSKGMWMATPVLEFANLKELRSLPPAAVELRVGPKEKDGRIPVHLKNVGETIAFFIEIIVEETSNGKPILPVLWEDNYISLTPGEVRQIGVRVPAFEGLDWRIRIKGMNLASTQTVPLVMELPPNTLGISARGGA